MFLKEYIRFLIKEVLDEDKFQDILKTLPSEYMRDVFQDEIKGIKSKYLSWVARELIKKYKDDGVSTGDGEIIRNEIDAFDKLVARNKIKDKDINQYTWQELHDEIEKANKPSQEELKKAAKSQATKIYESPDFLIIQPLSKEASIFYGKGTRWCVSALNDNMFENYTNRGFKFVFVINKKSPQDKMAIAYSNTMDTKPEVYVADDSRIGYDEATAHMSQEIRDVVNKHIGTDVFEVFDAAIFIKRLPRSLKQYDRFLMEATNKEIIAALEKLSQEDFSNWEAGHLPPRAYRQTFIKKVLERATRSMYNPEFQDEIYRLIRTAVDGENFGLQKYEIVTYLRTVISKKFKISEEVADPFVVSPKFMKRIVEKSKDANEFKYNLVGAMIEPSMADMFDVEAFQSAPAGTLWTIAKALEQSNYDFENLILGQ